MGKAPNQLVYNKVCARKFCVRASEVRIKFSLGFSAGFCKKCASVLIDSRIGTIINEQDNDK